MMWLIDFFSEVGEVLYKVVEFFVWFFESLFEALSLAARAMVSVGSYIAGFPAVWAAPFLAIITIALIFKLKG